MVFVFLNAGKAADDDDSAVACVNHGKLVPADSNQVHDFYRKANPGVRLPD
jgi:hypothetical protein